MTDLNAQRRAIRSLLDTSSPADAAAAYYALHHPDQATRLVTFPEDTIPALGYVCLSRTGMDLFRPLVTLRLPPDPEVHGPNRSLGALLLREAIPAGSDVIIQAPLSYRPLLASQLDVSQEETMQLYVLEGRFEPVVNVFVTRSDTDRGLPRFVIRQTTAGQLAHQGEVVASAGLNWQSPSYAEVYVNTRPEFRRQGLARSVLAALVQHVLDSARRPIYLVDEQNTASIQLAESVGFVDSGRPQILMETKRPGIPAT